MSKNWEKKFGYSIHSDYGIHNKLAAYHPSITGVEYVYLKVKGASGTYKMIPKNWKGKPANIIKSLEFQVKKKGKKDEYLYDDKINVSVNGYTLVSWKMETKTMSTTTSNGIIIDFPVVVDILEWLPPSSEGTEKSTPIYTTWTWREVG